MGQSPTMIVGNDKIIFEESEGDSRFGLRFKKPPENGTPPKQNQPGLFMLASWLSVAEMISFISPLGFSPLGF